MKLVKVAVAVLATVLLWGSGTEVDAAKFSRAAKDKCSTLLLWQLAQKDGNDTQKVFIYTDTELSRLQIRRLAKIGVTVYPDSWLPPTGQHPAGLTLAALKVKAINSLAAQTFIIRIETAERTVPPTGSGGTLPTVDSTLGGL